MKASLVSQIRQFGHAPVLVTLHPDAKRKDVTTIKKHFLKGATKTMQMSRGAPARASMSKHVQGRGPTVTADQYAPHSIRHFKRLGVVHGYVDIDGAKALDSHPSVKSVFDSEELSLITPVRKMAATITTKHTWALTKLEIPKLWRQGLTGKGVKVCHLDTGIDGSHPALKGKIAEFLEVDLNGDIVPNAKARDSDSKDGHGTHTAGTICGGNIGPTHIGVAPDAELYSGLVIEGGQVLLRVLTGMEWALEKQVRILNMSLGFPGYKPFALHITQSLVSQGVLPVFAIGNEGPFSSRSPGNYPQPLSVGAIDRNSQIAPYSSSQFFKDRKEWTPDVLAPGSDIYSAKVGGGGHCMDGSSMATPHTVGVAALLFEACPDATVDQVWNAITSTCIKLTVSSVWGFRFGVINPLEALKQLKANVMV